MLEVLKTVNRILRIVFIGAVGIVAVAKVLDIRPAAKTERISEDNEYNTSEFDEIW